MGAEESGRYRHLRGPVAVILILSSLTLIVQPFSDYGSAFVLTFSRPNVQVDAGPGSVSSSISGGPVIAAGIGGLLHAVWSDNRAGDYGIYYSQSIDGGNTWLSTDVRIDIPAAINSYAPYIAADTTGGPTTGNVYIVWQRNQASLADIYFTRSVDGGSTWSTRVRIDNAPADVGSFLPKMDIDTDGTIYVAFHDTRNGGINLDVFVTRSEDGGISWVPENQVSSSPNADSYPSLTAVNGVVYVAWQEAAPTSTWLWLAHSTNKGNNWAVNVITSASPPGDVGFVSIAVDVLDTVHAAWTLTDILGVRTIVYSQSSDRGLNWALLVTVSDSPQTIAYIPKSLTLVESSGVLYAVWTDNRNGDNDIFASWSEDRGVSWGDGIVNYQDVRVDDTDDNANMADDATEQQASSASPAPMGVYVLWSDMRDGISHAYFSSYTVSEIQVTEIRDSPDGMEEVEIFNHGGIDIDLTNWELVLDGWPYSLTSLGPISPGEYRTIGDSATSDLQVDISLGDEGGTVKIIDRFGVMRQSFAYGQQGPIQDPLSTESVARVPVGSAYSDFWARAATPTFGSKNGGRIPIKNPPIVLNEVLFNTTNQDDRYIELYFKGLGSIDLMDHELLGDSAYVFPSLILSEANPYYVLRANQASSLFSLLDESGDNLYLYTPGSIFMDMVGWSSGHIRDLSMVRVPDGFGTAEGYDDGTSVLAGWRFDQIPSLPLVLVGPPQMKGGDLGDRIHYQLNVTNKEITNEYVNIVAQPGTQGWQMTLFQADGITPLVDSPGDPDTIPDIGMLAPEQMTGIQVAIDIPSFAPAQDWEVSAVQAVLASNPLASASVALTTTITPYEEANLTANPKTIWVETSPPSYQPKETTLRLDITGRGTAVAVPRPQDVIIVMDSSGSMAQNDPSNMRLTAAKHYVDLLSVPDRAAVVDFDTTARLVNGHHLSSNYQQIKSNIDTIDSFGGTNLLDPIMLATNELIAFGNLSHVWIQILLTDGDDTAGNTPAQILAEAQRAANNGIVIFTIGLIGSGGVNEQLLQEIANLTGGVYLRAQTPSDLDSIYLLIGRMVKNLAGYDNDVTDDIPMVNLFLPSYIHFVSGSANPIPSYIGQSGGRTNLQWNISRIKINETWTATFRVTSGLSGTAIPATLYPNSVVSYIRYDETRITLPMPLVLIDVLAPPPPTVNYTITRSPLMGVVVVDGVNYTAPATFNWIVGSVHTIHAPMYEMINPGERWAFEFWDDGGNRTHDITVGSVDATIIAFYLHQYKPTVDIQGLDATHTVSARFTAMRLTVSQTGIYDIWSDWIDDGAYLDFDILAFGSDTEERWITLENFGVPPWSNVTLPFIDSVFYWHQVTPIVVVQGLPATYPAPIDYTLFGNANRATAYWMWSGWIDANTTLSVAGRVDVSGVERFVNVLLKGMNQLHWTVTSPATYTIPFIHQYKPTIRLLGLDINHPVHARYTFYGQNVDVPDQSSLWTDWVDDSSPLKFDMIAAGSNDQERRVTLEDFGVPPWDSVTSAFNRTVVYWHQVKPQVIFEGLPELHPVSIRFTQFSSQMSNSASDLWSDWVDRSSSLKVGGRIIVSDVERYINLVSKDMETLEWIITEASTHTIPFLHQFTPTVHLIGTDSEHTVSLMYTDTSASQPDQFKTGLFTVWSGWVDDGSILTFSNKTTGEPPHTAIDETVLFVDGAFEVTIVYAPPPPQNPEPNLKPVISVFFVLVLIVFGLFWGNRKPWDRHIPPPKEKLKPEEMATRLKMLKKMPIEEKLVMFDLKQLQEKFTEDRRWTMSVLVGPFATVEAILGAASLFTGILRVPEAGNWFSIGLIVNTAILLLGMGYNLAMQRYGYKVPSEEMLAKMRDVDGVDDELDNETEDPSAESESPPAK